jgi:hypothetical protein
MTHQEALESIVKAWEVLPAGDYSSLEVQYWLENEMWNAVNNAREALGMKRTDRENARSKSEE